MATSIHDMDPSAQRAAMAELKTTMESPGWGLFLQEIASEIEVIKDFLLTCHKDQAGFAQGRADQCGQVLDFEQMVDNYLDALDAEGEDAPV
jgi:hypothetical protein